MTPMRRFRVGWRDGTAISFPRNFFRKRGLMVSPRNDDPLLHSAYREALLVLAIWVSAGVYSVGYCALHGYGRSLDDVRLVMGFPDWIFWGVVVPWVTCAVVSGLVSVFLMTDDDLGAEVDEEDWENA
jgi:hypothetical protein